MLSGRNGVLFTAGHSVAQARRGRRKKPDLRTGGLAELIATHSGASALTALGSGARDPNWDDEHPFKAALSELAPAHRVVLDLHGMTDDHGVDVCIGSGADGHDPLVLEMCVRAAEAVELRVSVDDPFSAAGKATVTSTAQRLGLVAVQLEIAACRRDPARMPAEALVLIRWLLALVPSLARAGRTGT